MIEVKGGFLVQDNESNYLALPVALITGIRLLPKGAECDGEKLSVPMVQVFLGETQERWWNIYGADALRLPEAWSEYLQRREEENAWINRQTMGPRIVPLGAQEYLRHGLKGDE